ncbi:MAG: hypothetical protein AUI42_02815 [Actinobacteria bacterium 13_1_40CM_2_65_8]|nr:MAG: hypothetical protein AUH40_01140 [Chloroflexi bacterium 13_1_40CM_65_17]OLC66643.1 MAG: hypothetical protein AUH69_06550 [Actinobacteria bacterium 13_1_40CM_4_65_12]OLD50559.1 MAG: hypothetical protein AUI42_02815 [Actinobacteria bacterium 13_1_40CM_2_65_8]
MRRMLLVASGLVFLAGVPLFVGTEQTDRYFAWTVQPPITAAFLGASYWASCIFELAAARQRIWVRARVAVPAVLVFTTLTMVVTLVYLDRFHLSSTEPWARFVTWSWLAIYLGVPVMLGFLLLRQLREQGSDPLRVAPIPTGLRWLSAGQAAIMLLAGAALLLDPAIASWLWPWKLTALTGRAVGAWLIGFGVAALQATVEGDFDRIRIGLVTYVSLGALQLLALARYLSALQWARPVSWIYVGFLLSILGLGLVGLVLSTRSPFRRGLPPRQA